jgi:hypothetical protein
MKAWLIPGSRRRRVLLALGIWVVCTGVYFAFAPFDHITRHTIANHHALLADCWLHGRLDLAHAPPDYTQNNDFASYQGRWYVSFPPFPAVLMVPLVALAGTPEKVRDGQIWLWLAGVGPAVLFLVLEKLRRAGHSARTERINLLLTGLFAFGTVYFFTAEQGTVWFAAHVVAVALFALYLLYSIDAERPALAGVMLALAFASRGPSIALAAAFFLGEAVRVSRKPGRDDAGFWKGVDRRALLRRVGLFSAAVAPVLIPVLWHNYVRFGSIFEFGHHYLVIGWRPRIDKWGLFSYHYLPKNLGVMLTSLPWVTKVPRYLQINVHGLALWVTTPIFLWLLWPRRTVGPWRPLVIATVLVAVFDLCYQNPGWQQFGYRFSNDYALFMMAMLAVGGFRFGRGFWAAAALGVVINGFGALTFDRTGYGDFYYVDFSQQVIYQPD